MANERRTCVAVGVVGVVVLAGFLAREPLVFTFGYRRLGIAVLSHELPIHLDHGEVAIPTRHTISVPPGVEFAIVFEKRAGWIPGPGIVTREAPFASVDRFDAVDGVLYLSERSPLYFPFDD